MSTPFANFHPSGFILGNMSTLAIRIRTERTKLGLSQRDLASLIGVTNPAVSRYETGEALPRPRTMLKLAEVLGVDPEWLRTGKEDERPVLTLHLSDDELALLERFAKEMGVAPSEAAGLLVRQGVDRILKRTFANIGIPSISYGDDDSAAPVQKKSKSEQETAARATVNDYLRKKHKD